MNTKLTCAMILASIILTSSATFESEYHAKGIRAIIIHGEVLDKQVLISDMHHATQLYVSLLRAYKRGELADPNASVTDRDCIGIAAFLPLAYATSHIPVDLLRPEQANFKYVFYPAYGDQRAMLGSGRLMPDSLAVAFEKLGVPTKIARPVSSRCSFEPVS